MIKFYSLSKCVLKETGEKTDRTWSYFKHQDGFPIIAPGADQQNNEIKYFCLFKM